MKHNEFKLHLKPIADGAFTQLRLSGCVVTALPSDEIRRLVKQLWSWTGVGSQTAPLETALV